MMYKVFLAFCMVVALFLLYMERERAKVDNDQLIRDLEVTGYRRMRR
jgi:hypothetical protein